MLHATNAFVHVRVTNIAELSINHSLLLYSNFSIRTAFKTRIEHTVYKYNLQCNFVCMKLLCTCQNVLPTQICNRP